MNWYVPIIWLLCLPVLLSGCTTAYKEEKRQRTLPSQMVLELGVFEDARTAEDVDTAVKHQELYVYRPHLILGSLRTELPKLVQEGLNNLNAQPQDIDPNKPTQRYYVHYILQALHTKLLKGNELSASLESRVLVRDAQANIVWQNVLTTEKRQPNNEKSGTKEQKALAALIKEALKESLDILGEAIWQKHAQTWSVIGALQ